MIEVAAGGPPGAAVAAEMIAGAAGVEVAQDAEPKKFRNRSLEINLFDSSPLGCDPAMAAPDHTPNFFSTDPDEVVIVSYYRGFAIICRI